MKGENMQILMQTDHDKSISDETKGKMLANPSVNIQQKMIATFPSEDLENIQCFSASPTNNYRALN